MRGWKVLSLVALALAVAVQGVRAPEARAEAFKDDKLGYGFSYPSHWNVVPVDAGDWLVAKFTSNREYDLNNAKDYTRWLRHRPYIEVVVIPYAAKEDKGTTVEKTDKGVKVSRNAPWKDVKEYMDKSFQDRRIGGFHFSGEDDTTVNGLKVRRFEITVDKDVTGERRIYGWEFATDDCFYGLVAEILAQEEKHLKPELFQAFSTFKAFQRTGTLPNAAKTGEDVTVKDDKKKDADREITPEELKKKRDDATNRALGKIKGNLQPGWSISEAKNFIGISHSDPKYTHEVLAHCEALRAWLEKQFGYVGSGYAGKVIIRICCDRQEYDQFLQAKTWSSDAPEAYTFKDKDGWSDWTFNWLNSRVYWIWMNDKNQALLWAFPEWLSAGMTSFVDSVRSKNGVIEFKANTWENVDMKNLRRSDDIIAPKTYFTSTSEAMAAQKWPWVQNQFFMNFLINGAASRNPKYKSILSDYIKNLIFLLDTEKAPNPADAKVPQNEKEEEEMVKARQQAWRQNEQTVLQKLLDKTFAGWTDKEWDAFNALYRQDLK